MDAPVLSQQRYNSVKKWCMERLQRGRDAASKEWITVADAVDLDLPMDSLRYLPCTVLAFEACLCSFTLFVCVGIGKDPSSCSCTCGLWQRQRTLFARNCSRRSEEHTSELQTLMRISYAVFCLKKK